MEQLFEVVFKPIAGYRHVATEGPGGELIVRLVPFSTSGMGDGKAEFFTKINQQAREQVKAWLEGLNEGKNEKVKYFLKRVREAVHNVGYDYWIATIEPSVEEGKIYYAKNKAVGENFSSNEWNEMAKNYAPERGSRLASLDELFIWYALRIVNGFWTLDNIVNGSLGAGNYKNAPESSHDLRTTGTVFCGGYFDGQGNTFKVVTRGDGFAVVGGSFHEEEDDYPVTFFYIDEYPDFKLPRTVGVLTLTE